MVRWSEVCQDAPTEHRRDYYDRPWDTSLPPGETSTVVSVCLSAHRCCYIVTVVVYVHTGILNFTYTYIRTPTYPSPTSATTVTTTQGGWPHLLPTLLQLTKRTQVSLPTCLLLRTLPPGCFSWVDSKSYLHREDKGSAFTGKIPKSINRLLDYLVNWFPTA